MAARGLQACQKVFQQSIRGFRSSPLSKSRAILIKNDELDEFRSFYPEFLPDPNPTWRNNLREKLERLDMLKRRTVLQIPEFYVGTIMAVTVSDDSAPGKKSRFLGICTQRFGYGLRHRFVLRNVLEHQGVEIMYDLYCPLLLEIEVIRLEKRLDDNLMYLRDALPEYSTFPQDMRPEQRPEGSPVPVNSLKVQMKPRPWTQRWERKGLKGVINILDMVTEKMRNQEASKREPWLEYDLMREYRSQVPWDEQLPIWEELKVHRETVEEQQKRDRRRRLLTQTPAKSDS